MPAFIKIIYAQLIFVYLFAYGIKIYGVPLSIFMGVASAAYLYIFKLTPKFIKIWKYEIVLIAATFLYLLIIEILQGIQPSLGNFSFYIIRILTDGILPAYVIANIGNKLKITFKEFTYILSTILIIELIFAILMIFSPDLKTSIFSYIADFSDQSIWKNEYVFINRGFGIAYSYLSWFSFALALIFIFFLFGNEPKSIIYLSILTIATVSLIALNARIGFIPIFIGLSFYVIFNGKPGVIKIASMALIIITIVSIIGFFNASEQLNDRIEFFGKWILDDGFSSINSREGSETLGDLSNYRILGAFTPFDFMFGRGDILTPKAGILYTDVGYMQILYTGGLTLSILLYCIFYLFARRLAKLSYILSKKEIIPHSFIYYPPVLYIAFIIGHYKLRIFEINEASRFLLLLISLFIVLSNAFNTKCKSNDSNLYARIS